MTAPERWETTVEDDGGHDLALSGLAFDGVESQMVV
jgi:hypothetical protein